MAVESKHTKISFPLPPVFFTVLWLIVQYSQAHRRAESIFTLKTEILLHTFSARLRHGLNSLQSKGNDQLGRLEKIFVKRWMPALILLVTLVQMHTIPEAQGLNLALHVLVFPFSRSYSFRTHLKSVSFLKTDHIVAMGAFGGRMDHCLANINTLYTALTLSKAPLYLFYDNSMACLLDKVRHICCLVVILSRHYRYLCNFFCHFWFKWWTDKLLPSLCMENCDLCWDSGTDLPVPTQ